MDNQLAVFDNKPIRSILHEGEMFFSIVDIIEVLTESSNPGDYWKKKFIDLGFIAVQVTG